MSSDSKKDTDTVLKDGEPDTIIKKKKKSNSKRERGLALTDCVNQTAAEQSDIITPNPNLNVQKKKAGSEITR
jgi:hypothetical protein